MKTALSTLAIFSLAMLLFSGCDSGDGDEGGTTCEACEDVCSGGQCLDTTCQPDCADSVCGDDGCGGSCGSCSLGEDCQDGQCSGDAPGGVWTDPDSGLTWMDPPVAFAQGNVKNWESAAESCATLDLDGNTDWRLPTIDELRTLIRACPSTMTDGACGAGDACSSYTCFLDSPPCIEGCASSEGPVDAGAGLGCYWPEAFGMKASCFLYWSSTPVSTLNPMPIS